MRVSEDRPVVHLGGKTYEWIEEWATLPQTEARRAVWPHTGIVTTDKDQIVTFDGADSALVTFDRDGRPLNRVPIDIGEAHGITLVVEDGSSVLWLADASVKKAPNAGYAAPEGSASSTAVKVAKDRIAMSLARRHPLRFEFVISHAAAITRPSVQRRMGC